MGDVMLRITIHEDEKVCRLELAGRLEGPWVTETENAWWITLDAIFSRSFIWRGPVSSLKAFG
jgi:hypothetical protein